MRYGFFPGCAYKTAAGYKESVDVLNRALGIEFIEIDDWNCCGATAFFSLDETDALTLSGRIFALAEKAGLNQIATVCNACYTTLRKVKKTLENHPDKTEKVNARLAGEGLAIGQPLPVRHYLEVLFHDIPDEKWMKGKGTLHSETSHSGMKIGAYYGCQFSRPWRDVDRPERPVMLDRFLEKLGFSAVGHSAGTQCCGASHAVAYSKECAPLISRIVREIRAKGGEAVATICPLCQFNLDSGQKPDREKALPVLFFTQIAGLALGIDPEKLGMGKLLNPLS